MCCSTEGEASVYSTPGVRPRRQRSPSSVATAQGSQARVDPVGSQAVLTAPGSQPVSTTSGESLRRSRRAHTVDDEWGCRSRVSASLSALLPKWDSRPCRRRVDSRINDQWDSQRCQQQGDSRINDQWDSQCRRRVDSRASEAGDSQRCEQHSGQPAECRQHRTAEMKQQWTGR